MSRDGTVSWNTRSPLEPLELYTKKSGDGIVGQLYAFTDKGDRQVALRPEMTPTLARMVLCEGELHAEAIRWFSVRSSSLRRQQKGRLREHFQLNVDIRVRHRLPPTPSCCGAIDVMRSAWPDFPGCSGRECRIGGC